MATKNELQTLSFEAENDFDEKYVCVELGTSSGQVDLPDASNEMVIGVTQATADDGNAVPVMTSGVTKVVAGGTFSKGDYLTAVTTTGRVQKAPRTTSSWSGSNDSVENIIGVALEASTEAGQIVSMLIRPMILSH